MLDYRVLTFLALYDEMNYRRTAEKLNMQKPRPPQADSRAEHRVQRQQSQQTHKTAEQKYLELLLRKHPG